MGIVKRVACLVLLVLVSLFLASCDIGLVIVDIEIAQLPYKIVYYASSGKELDLSGGIVRHIAHNGRSDDRPMRGIVQIYDVVYHIDFSVPGEYEVQLIFEPPGSSRDTVIQSFTIYVVERELRSQES